MLSQILRRAVPILPRIALALGAAWLSACASSESTGRVKPTGALGDTGRFHPEGGDRGTLVWIDHSADFAAYRNVYVPPVVVKGTSKPKKKDRLKPGERKELADYCQFALQRELGKDYRIVSGRDPNTLEFKVVITEASKSVPMLDSATTLYPTAFVSSYLMKGVTGSHSFTGRAAVEIDVKDASSQKRVIGVMSSRTGGKDWKNKFDKWKGAKAAIDHWAVQARERMARLRKGGSNA